MLNTGHRLHALATSGAEFKAFGALASALAAGGARATGRLMVYGGRTVLADAVALLKGIVDLFSSANLKLREAIAHGLVYLIMAVLAYGGFHIVRADLNVGVGLRAAFGDPRADQAARDLAVRDDFMQYQLRAATTSDGVINQILQTVLLRATGAARVRLAVIHDGVPSLTGFDMMRYDVTNAVAAPGRSGGETRLNSPLSLMSDYLPTLLQDKCKLQRSAEIQNVAARTGLIASQFLACPVVDFHNLTLGVIFVSWDNADAPPQGAEFETLVAAVKLAGREIGTALDLRTAAALTPRR